MAVSCPKCGWQYDVTLFQFGRTINCACGERVGLEKRIELPKAELRFFADVMMHRLVRWLRAMGFDTAWEDAIPDSELVRRSFIEHRHILTLDRRLPVEWRVDNILLLNSEDSLQQFREVVSHFELKPPKQLFTRCLLCNTELRPAAPANVAEQVPESIRHIQHDFRYCSNCRKVFWQGSHTGRMSAAIENIFAERSNYSPS